MPLPSEVVLLRIRCWENRPAPLCKIITNITIESLKPHKHKQTTAYINNNSSSRFSYGGYMTLRLFLIPLEKTTARVPINQRRSNQKLFTIRYRCIFAYITHLWFQFFGEFAILISNPN
ncbi:hypothetical protein L1887_07617 [Cichorium endivia]|nr:hypothetical protein L1887_07617 [Cichorium endivia]